MAPYTFGAMSSSESSRRRLPKSVALGGLALAAVSSGSLLGVSGAAHATDASATPVNGPIAYSVMGASEFQWHTVDPDGKHDAVVPVGKPSPDTQPDIAGAPAYDVMYSPDGSRALFTGVNGCEYLADADGTGALALTAVTQKYWVPCTSLSTFVSVPSLPTPIDAAGWAWSADSKSVFFADKSGAVGTLSADGTTVTKLPVTVPAGYRLESVSPQGALAFADGTAPGHIAILDPGASKPRVLTTGFAARFSASTGGLLVNHDILPPSGTGGWAHRRSRSTRRPAPGPRSPTPPLRKSNPSPDPTGGRSPMSLPASPAVPPT